MIFIGSDHVGFDLKNIIRPWLESIGYLTTDCGCFSSKRVDYPVYAYEITQKMLTHQNSRGLLFCGTGVGMNIAASKIPNIRAVNCTDTYTAEMSRRHNNTNILCLGSRVLGLELAKSIIQIWLNSPYEAARHEDRLKMISALEQNHCLENLT